MARHELYSLLCAIMLISGIVGLVHAIVIYPPVGVVAAGCFCGFVYFGRLYGRETEAVHRNRMIAQWQDVEFRSCIACGGPFDGRDDGTAYHLMTTHEHMGTMSVHHGPVCIVAGLDVLKENALDAGADSIRAVHRIGGETFQYDMFIKNGFYLEYVCENQENPWTQSFLRLYVDNDGLALVKFGGTDERGGKRPEIRQDTGIAARLI